MKYVIKLDINIFYIINNFYYFYFIVLIMSIQKLYLKIYLKINFYNYVITYNNKPNQNS